MLQIAKNSLIWDQSFDLYAFQYLLTIILLLFGECTVCIIAVFWPHILGIDVRPARLIRALQRSYAVPGREQFTAALDLAQTTVSFVVYGVIR